MSPRAVDEGCALHAVSAMGTRFEFVLAGGHERDAAAAMQEEVLTLHERWSAFRKDSFVSHINREAVGGAVRVDGDTWNVLMLARDVWRASRGAFDITVGSLMRRHGFRELDALPPGDDLGADGGRSWGMDAVELDEGAKSVRFLRPGIALDPGAIAKGYALDRCAEIARECGVERALLHGGTSTVVAIGAPPGRIGWTVRLMGGKRPPVVHLSGAALSVSAGHSRTVTRGGRELGHIVDPRTGDAIDAIGSAAVIAEHAASADAWSTAMYVLGDVPEGAGAMIQAGFLDREDGPWRVSPGAAAYDGDVNRFVTQG